MPVLDLLCHDSRITRVTLVEPDIYKPHNVERHLFSPSGIGESKAGLAELWVKERRPDLDIQILECDLLASEEQGAFDEAIADADIGVCAADNEPAKHQFDALMRKHKKPWTLGEVLSGGIGADNRFTLPLVTRLVREHVSVTEDEIAAAMRFVFLRHHVVAEGGGSVTVAAALASKLPRGDVPLVLVVSGGNVDPRQLWELVGGA